MKRLTSKLLILVFALLITVTACATDTYPVNRTISFDRPIYLILIDDTLIPCTGLVFVETESAKYYKCYDGELPYITYPNAAVKGYKIQ